MDDCEVLPYSSEMVPVFRSEVDSIHILAVWVRVPRLFLQFFNKAFLARIRDRLGRTLRIDETTLIAYRSQYALINVKVDLDKPLLPNSDSCIE